jgi:hypothetical protein
MDYQDEKSSRLLNKNLDGSKRKIFSEPIELAVALKDVPLEVRREEAKKPLYLTRYE